MSDWADFCDSVGINPNNPDEFDDWLARQQERTPDQRMTASRRLTQRQKMAFLANPFCTRCRGTGYIGMFNWNCGGRCFACLPDELWEETY
jgi:hypothetical protein